MAVTEVDVFVLVRAGVQGGIEMVEEVLATFEEDDYRALIVGLVGLSESYCMNLATQIGVTPNELLGASLEQATAEPMLDVAVSGEQFWTWLQQGVSSGFCTELECGTHNGPVITDTESAEIDEGLDPCIPILRVWFPPDDEEADT